MPNERQIKAAEYAMKKGSITDRECLKLNSTTKRTATRGLGDLVRKGIFNAIGKGKRELNDALWF